MASIKPIAFLVLWTSLIGPVIYIQPAKKEEPGVEKRLPLKIEPLKKDLPANQQVKQKPFKL